MGWVRKLPNNGWWEYWENGDHFTPVMHFHCPICGDLVWDALPYVLKDDTAYCVDCSYKEGFVTEEKYLSFFHEDPKKMRAVIHDGKIIFTDRRRRLPWEKSKAEKNAEERKSSRYVEWRTKCLERDGYKCAICGKVGGTLNVHHIKPFAKYPKLRFDADNGVTLCETCHRRVHKENDNEWIHP